MKIGGIIVAALLLFSVVMLLFGHRSDSPLQFDSEVWKHQENSNQRLRMVSDLKPKLMGISKVEVEQLLGTPRKDLGSSNRAEYFYLLGTEERFLDTDGIWLRIKFKNDCVNDVQVWQD